MASANAEIRVQLKKTNYTQWGLEFIQKQSGEISVKNIIESSVASHSGIRVGDVLLSIDGKSASAINLQWISSYFATVVSVDLVFRRVVPAVRPPMNPITSREVIDLLDDDDEDDFPVSARSSNPPASTSTPSMARSQSAPAQSSSSSLPLPTIMGAAVSVPPRTAAPSLASSIRRPASEVIDLVSTDDEQDRNDLDDVFGDSSEEDVPISTLMANRAAAATAAAAPLRNFVDQARTVSYAPRNVTSVRPPQPPVVHQPASASGASVLSPSLLNPAMQSNGQNRASTVSVPIIPTMTSSVGQKRPLETTPASSASAPSSTSASAAKKLKIGKIEVKDEFVREPKGFGECNVGDEVIEVRGLDDDGSSETPDVVGGGGGSTPASAMKGSSAAPSVMDLDDDDADFTVLGGNMQTAGDMPHQRESCTVHPYYSFAKFPQLVFKNNKYCANCYCYVCDVNANFCCEWNEHCHATYKDGKWKLEKQARTSRIMNLMSPEKRVAFYAHNRQYMNSKASANIKGYFVGTPNDRITGITNISPQDKAVAGEMINLISKKLDSLAGSASETQQAFLEASALLLKLITWPTFPAWEFEGVMELFVGWLFNNANTSEIRSIVREEVNGMLMSRSCTAQFRSLMKLFQVSDLKFTWLHGSTSSSVIAARGPPPDFLKTVCEFDTTCFGLIVSELSKLQRFGDLTAVVNAFSAGADARILAVYHLIRYGGIERLNNAADLVAGITSFKFFSSPRWSRLLKKSLLVFLAHLLDVNFLTSFGEGVQRCRSQDAMEYFFQEISRGCILNLASHFAVIQKKTAGLLDQLPSPTVALSEWVLTVLPKLNPDQSDISVIDEASIFAVMLLTYLNRRIGSIIPGKTVSSFRICIKEMVDRVVNPENSVLALVTANAATQSWKVVFAPSPNGAIQKMDVKLLIACCIARKIVEQMADKFPLVAPQIKREWSILPQIQQASASQSAPLAPALSLSTPLTASFQFQPVSGNLVAPVMNASDNGSRPSGFVSAASLVPTSTLSPSTSFCIDFSTANDPQQSLVVSFNSPYAVLKGVLLASDADPNVSLVSHRLIGNNLDYSSLYGLCRILNNLAFSSPFSSLTQFITVNIELCRVLWKNFLISSHLAIADEGADKGKLAYLQELLSSVYSLVKRFCSISANHGNSDILNPVIADEWFKQLGGIVDVATRESLILAINFHAVATFSTFQNNETQKQSLRGLKKFFSQTVCENDVACLQFHAYYLLGHLTMYRRELWNDFWSPLVSLFLKTRAYPSPACGILLEEWDRLKSQLTGSVDFGKMLLQGLYDLVEEDFALIDRNMGARRLIDLVDGLCHDARLVNMISDLLLNGMISWDNRPIWNENSALAAVVRRLPVARIRDAAGSFVPYFALLVREFKSDASEEKRQVCESIRAFYASSLGPWSQNAILCLCYLGMFTVACPLIQSQFQAQKYDAELLKKALMHCESLDQFEEALGLLESVLATVYLKQESVRIMQPLINKFTAIHNSQLTESSSLFLNPPFALLIFFHNYDEPSFYGFWSSERTETRPLISQWMKDMERSDRVDPRRHMSVLFLFYNTEDLKQYFLQFDYKNCKMNKDELVMVLLEKLGEVAGARSIICVAIAKLLLNMPVLSDGIRSAIVALNKPVVEALSSLIAEEGHSSTNIVGSAAEDSENLTLDVAVSLILCLNAPTDLTRLQALKKIVHPPLSARIFVLLKDFSQPGPTVAMLLVDREFGSLAEFLIEVIKRESSDECRLVCQAVDQLTLCLSAECIVPAHEVPSTPGRASKASQEQCHREFFRPTGLIRSIGRFVMQASEKRNCKELSTRFSGMAKQIETSIDAFIQKVFDLTSFDMMIFYYLHLCFTFHASHFATFISHYDANGYFNVIDTSSSVVSGTQQSASSSSSGGGLSLVPPASVSSSAGKEGSVGGGSFVTEIVETIVTQPSNYMSDLKKMEELFAIYVNHQSILKDNVACFATLPSFIVLMERVFQKPTSYYAERSSLSPSRFDKGLFWLRPGHSVPVHQYIRQSLDALLLKHRALAAAVFEGPILTRLIDKDQVQYPESSELKNFHTRKLLQDMGRFVVDGSVGTNDLWTYITMDSWPVNCFQKIKFTLMKLIDKRTFPSWLSLISTVLRGFCMSGQRINEILEMIFFRFKYMGSDRGIFTSAVQEELIQFLLTERSLDLKHEIMTGDYTRYRLSDIMNHPKLLNCLSFDNADILYEPSQFNLWRELLKSEKKDEMAHQLLKVFLNVVHFVATERASPRLRSLFEDFVKHFRSCFNGFGEGAKAILLSAKTEAKQRLRTKQAVVKLLAPLDT